MKWAMALVLWILAPPAWAQSLPATPLSMSVPLNLTGSTIPGVLTPSGKSYVTGNQAAILVDPKDVGFLFGYGFVPHTGGVRYVIEAGAAGCNGIVPGTSTNIAPSVDAAVTMGFTTITIPPNCLWQPDANTTPSDVTIEGMDWEKVVIASSSPTTLNVSMGARSEIKNVAWQDAFCYNGWGVANTARICPVKDLVNNSDSVWTPTPYPGIGIYVHSDQVTYAGVTTTAGNGGQPAVFSCNTGDCIFSEADNASANALRLVSQADSAAIKAIQFTSDSSGVAFSINKAGGTEANPTVIPAGAHILDINLYGYDGANYTQSAQIFTRVIGTVSSGIVPGLYALRLAGAGGGLNDAFVVDGLNGAIKVGSGDVQISDFSGNLQSANGATCAAGTVSLSTLVVTKGVVTHC